MQCWQTTLGRFWTISGSDTVVCLSGDLHYHAFWPRNDGATGAHRTQHVTMHTLGLTASLIQPLLLKMNDYTITKSPLVPLTLRCSVLLRWRVAMWHHNVRAPLWSQRDLIWPFADVRILSCNTVECYRDAWHRPAPSSGCLWEFTTLSMEPGVEIPHKQHRQWGSAFYQLCLRLK